MSYLVKISLFSWGLLATLDSLTMRFRMGALGYMILAQSLAGLEIEVSHVDSQSALHDQASKIIMETKTQVNFLGWQYCMPIVTHCFQKSWCSWLHWERTARSSAFGIFVESAPSSLPFAGFHMCPFTVTNDNCQYNSCQWYCESCQWIIKADGGLGDP